MNMETIRKTVGQKIIQLIKEFKKYPEKFLTEEDLRSYLYSLLLKEFNKIEKSIDDSESIPLHCEIRWLGKSGKLRYRSDIVLFDVSTLRTKNIDLFKVPSKGYGFNNPQIIIEIKLRRKGTVSNNKFCEKIKSDRTKLSRIRKDVPGNFYSYLVIFDKKNNLDLKAHKTKNRREYYVYPYENQELKKNG